jgi:hypothetical protein
MLAACTEYETSARWPQRRSGGLGSRPRDIARCSGCRCVAADIGGRATASGQRCGPACAGVPSTLSPALTPGQRHRRRFSTGRFGHAVSAPCYVRCRPSTPPALPPRRTPWSARRHAHRTGHSARGRTCASQLPRTLRVGDPRGAGLGIESQSVRGAGRSPSRKYPSIWGGSAQERPRSRSGNLYS